MPDWYHSTTDDLVRHLAAATLERMGYTQVLILDGGINHCCAETAMLAGACKRRTQCTSGRARYTPL